MVRWRRAGKRTVVWLVVLSLVAASVLVAYGGTPHRAEAARLDAVREDPDVVVESSRGGYVLRDADPSGERVGLVVYPGGRVEAAAYLWTLAPLVERTDVRVFVPEMPLHLAVLDPGRAADVMAAHPAVETWYVGGHSLGGAMACRFAANHPDRVRGVVLLAAYCPEDASLRNTDLPVLTVTGERDGVIALKQLKVFHPTRVPGDARFVELAGVNHSQFGAYGGRPGDRPATASDRAARRRLTDALVDWFGNRTT